MLDGAAPTSAVYFDLQAGTAPALADRVPAAVLVRVVGAEDVPGAGVPAYGFFGMNRPAVGYNDYTWDHLPGLNWRPDLPRKADAIFAIFAARIAFSSLEIRSLLKYGVNAFKSVRWLLSMLL